MKQWGLTMEEEERVDSAISAVPEDAIPENWKHYVIGVPESFVPIFEATLKGFQLLYDTEKKFPAFEAIVMEARNALPQEIIDTIVVTER